jgi:NADH dehydrogenase FAD-containing subunit
MFLRLGDSAVSKGWNSQPVPGLAPAAKQAGAYVDRLIRAKIEGRAAPSPSNIVIGKPGDYRAKGSGG